MREACAIENMFSDRILVVTSSYVRVTFCLCKSCSLFEFLFFVLFEVDSRRVCVCVLCVCVCVVCVCVCVVCVCVCCVCVVCVVCVLCFVCVVCVCVCVVRIGNPTQPQPNL